MASPQNTFFAYSPSQILIFDGEHYDFWSSQMEMIFVSQDLWDIIEDNYEKWPKSSSSESWTATKKKQYKENVKRNATAVRIIQ